MTKEIDGKTSKIFNIFLTLFLLIALVGSGFLIYELLLLSSIETLIRYIVVGVLVFIDFCFLLKYRRIVKGKVKKKKKSKNRLFVFFLILYAIICYGLGGVIFYVYQKIDGLNKDSVTYTSSLLVMSSNQATKIDDVSNMKIGILKDSKSPEGYIIPQEIIKENQSKKDFLEFKNPVKKEYREPLAVNEEYKEIEANVEIPKVKICYKMPIRVFGNIDRKILNIYLSIILRNNFGATSYLREELLEKELVVAIGAGREIFKDVVTIEVNVETKYPDEVIPIIKEKMANLELTQEDLKRRIKCNIAALINDFDDIEYVNSNIVDDLISYGKVFDNMYAIYNGLKLKEAKDIISSLDLQYSSTVLLIPFKE